MQAAIVITVLMLLLWLLSIRRSDVSIIDIGWGLGFVLIAWTSWLRGSQSVTAGHPSILLPTLVTLWGARLSIYLFWRNHGKPEDYRYRHMREKCGDSFWFVSLITIFLLQGVIMWIVSLPLQTVAFEHAPLWSRLLNIMSLEGGSVELGSTLLKLCGIVLWCVGLLFETVGDWQLARFKSLAENKGRVLQSGLWRYTRHPNYFGDFMVWWGLFFVALALHAPWWTIISPIVMTFLLLRISGVALLEKALSQNKPEYNEYVQRTSAFFPKPPRRDFQ